MIINGIEELATRSDLLDRSLLVELPVIDDAERVDEKDLWTDFERVQPMILGAIFDAVAGALREVEQVRLERAPRMADFARWVVAAEPSLGWPSGSFMDTYAKNRDESNEIAIEASPIGALLCEIADQGFNGTTAELLALLTDKAEEKITKSKSWPRTARGLAAHVTRLAPNLRKLGYAVEHGRAPNRNRTRTLELRRTR